MAFLDDYESVADRLEKFWADNPEGRILTDLVHHDGKTFIVKAEVYRKHSVGPDATGYAEETIGATPVNKTSALENCETSAIGRALANLGYASKGQRPSREEMAKTQGRERQRSGGRKTTPTPEASQTPVNGGQAHLTPEQAIEIAGIKRSLLARLDGDKEEASRLWEGTIRNFGLDPKQPLPADMIPAVEHAIKSLGIKGE